MEPDGAEHVATVRKHEAPPMMRPGPGPGAAQRRADVGRSPSLSDALAAVQAAPLPLFTRVSRTQPGVIRRVPHVEANVKGNPSVFDLATAQPTDFRPEERPGVLAALRMILQGGKLREPGGRIRSPSQPEIAQAQAVYAAMVGSVSKRGDDRVFERYEQFAQKLDLDASSFSSRHDLIYGVHRAALQMTVDAGGDPDALTKISVMKEEMVAVLLDDEMARAITGIVRSGGEHEQVLTSETVRVMIDDLQAPPDLLHQSTERDAPGGKIAVQTSTNVPTQWVILNSTQVDEGKVRQVHHPTSDKWLASVDADGKSHQTPGTGEGSSPDYHLGPRSLQAAIRDSGSAEGLIARLLRVNIDRLATGDDILAVPASERAHQSFTTTKGATLWFDRQNDLELIAKHVDVRTAKIIDLLVAAKQSVAHAGEASAAEDSADEGDHLERDEDSDGSETQKKGAARSAFLRDSRGKRKHPRTKRERPPVERDDSPVRASASSKQRSHSPQAETAAVAAQSPGGGSMTDDG